MAKFLYLDKEEKVLWLPRLFDLMYENMQKIAPSGLPYDQEKAQWLAEVSPALDKAPRQILLCFVGGTLAGFTMYYTRQRMLMVEELQLIKQYHRTGLFGSLCRQLLSALPEDLQTVEAYAHRQNDHSVRLMKKLGMELCGADPRFLRLRGPADSIRQLLR